MANRLALMLSIFTLLACSFSVGQDSSKVQVFGGYSFLNLDNGGIAGGQLDTVFGAPGGTFGTSSSFNGWEAQLQFKAKKNIGIVADFSGNYGNLFTAASGSGVSGLPSTQSYSFLFGPEISASRGKISPFVHALFGVNRLSSSSTNSLSGVSFLSLPSVSDTAFAMALGGGVDYNINSKFGLRLGQFDYLYTGQNMNTFANNIFGGNTFSGLSGHQNNLRFSTGIVFRF